MSRFAKTRIMEMAPFSLFFAMIWLTLFGTLEKLLLGYQILIPLVIAFAAVSFLINKDSIKLSDFKELLSLPVVAFSFFVIWIFYQTENMVFIQWDEFTQWGIAPKAIYLFDALPPSAPAMIDNAGYTPGLAVLSYAANKLNGSWSEGLVFWTYQLIFLTIIFSVISKLDYKKIWYAFTCLVILLMSAIIFYDFFQTVYADPILSIVFGYSLKLAFDKETTKNKPKLFAFIASVISIYLIKDIGTVLGAISIFALGVNAVVNLLTNKSFKLRQILLMVYPILLSLIALVAARTIWISYSTKIDLLDGLGSTTSRGGAVTSSVLGSSSLSTSEIWTSYISSLKDRPITSWNGIGLSAYSWIFIILLLLIGNLIQNKFEKIKQILNIFIIIFGAVIYFYVIYFAYMNYFGPTGPSFPSFERYISTYLSGIVFYLAIESCAQVSQNINFSKSESNFAVPGISFLIVTLLFFYSPQGRLIQYIRTPSAYSETFKTVFSNMRTKIDLADFKPTDKIYVITEHKQGYEYYFLSYEAFPGEVANMPFSIGPEYGENDYWTDTNLDADAWNKVLDDFDYVILYSTSDVSIGETDELFKKEYESLFESPIEPETIYFVEHSESGNKLVKFI